MRLYIICTYILSFNFLEFSTLKNLRIFNAYLVITYIECRKTNNYAEMKETYMCINSKPAPNDTRQSSA